MRWLAFIGVVAAVQLRHLLSRVRSVADPAAGLLPASPAADEPLPPAAQGAPPPSNVTNVTWPTEKCRFLELPKEYKVDDGGPKPNNDDGALRHVLCSSGNLPTRGTEANITCNNGTWEGIRFIDAVVIKPIDLNCEDQEKVRLLKEVMHYLDYTNKTLIDTESRGYPWDDSLASARKGTLKTVQSSAVKVINDTTMDIWPEVDGLNYMIKAFVDNNFEPRGVPFTEASCANFANHTMYKYPDPAASGPNAMYASSNVAPTLPDGRPGMFEKSGDWSCSQTKQKTSTGWDYLNAVPVMYYRVGCYCESKMLLGCPMKWPMYKHFGFSALDQKNIAGSDLKALCWFWSDPVHPEWGYLADDAPPTTHVPNPVLAGPPGFPDGIAHVEAPLVNSTAWLG